mgnify:CR=1 FL=1
MKENILIVLAVLILVGTYCQNCCCKSANRYEVVTGNNMLTILVDKKTGETWRNCICGAQSNVPGCWEKMITINSEDFNKPVGEAKAIKKMLKLQNKTQSRPVNQVPQKAE